MKIIFVASDFSGLGKGTFAASLGRLLKSHGVDVRVMKCDLYYNYDAGTINPFEHGEVYVLADGTETDQDLGIYERYLGIECNALDYLTSGRVHHQVYLNERAGKYLGQTVSVEHVIEEIKNRILAFANQCEVGIVELGATIGDIKGTFFLEACRQLRADLGTDDSAFVLLSHFPYLSNVGEVKTMGCQRSVNDLRSKGIKPDIIIARTQSAVQLTDYQLRKIELFCEVPKGATMSLPDLEDPYEIPRFLRSSRVHSYLSLRMRIPLGEDKLDSWYNNFAPANDLRIAIVGKYAHADAYHSILQQLRFVGVRHIQYMPAPDHLEKYDAVILPGGWGERGVEPIIDAARICREQMIPCFGICLGLQVMAIEWARNVLHLTAANSTEFDRATPHPVVLLQEEQAHVSHLGGTARLGNWTTQLESDSVLTRLFGAQQITQRHRHRYEINSSVPFGEFRVTGRDAKTGLIEAMEYGSHPFYVGVQWHPEFTPHKNPLFLGLVNAAARRRRGSESSGDGLVSFLRNGTPGTYLSSLNLSDESRPMLERIACMSEAELKAEGITPDQQAILLRILALLDERERTLQAVEHEIQAAERQMWEINSCVINSAATSTRAGRDEELGRLQKTIDDATARLREHRITYDERLSRLDEELRKTFRAVNFQPRQV